MPRTLAIALSVTCAALLGAASPRSQENPAAVSSDEMAKRQQHWAWQPLRDVRPASDDHPVDALLGAELRAHGLTPSPPALSLIHI